MIRDSQDRAGKSICRSPSGPGITVHLPGDSSELRPDQDMGMWMGKTRWSPWPGRAGLWDLQTGPAAGSLGQAFGLGELPWGPEPWAGWGGTLERGSGPPKPSSAVRALTYTSPGNLTVF